jgi:hypothetical protein
MRFNIQSIISKFHFPSPRRLSGWERVWVVGSIFFVLAYLVIFFILPHFYSQTVTNKLPLNGYINYEKLEFPDIKKLSAPDYSLNSRQPYYYDLQKEISKSIQERYGSIFETPLLPSCKFPNPPKANATDLYNYQYTRSLGLYPARFFIYHYATLSSDYVYHKEPNLPEPLNTPCSVSVDVVDEPNSTLIFDFYVDYGEKGAKDAKEISAFILNKLDFDLFVYRVLWIAKSIVIWTAFFLAFIFISRLLKWVTDGFKK